MSLQTDHAKSRSLVANLEKGRKEQLIMDAHAGTEDHHEHVSRSQVASKLQARFGFLEEDLITKTSAKHIDGAEDGFVNIVSCGLREQLLDTHSASLRSFLRSIIIEQREGSGFNAGAALQLKRGWPAA